jgi:DNA replication and repair protein RecF
MDMAICQYNPRYIRALSVYKRAKEQKTKILRDFPEKPSLLDVMNEFTEKMIQSGEFIIHERKMFIESLKEKANIYHSGISGNREILNIDYSPKTNLRAEMDYKRERKIQKRVCLVGPHRDDFNISLSGLNSRIFASQGQLRTAALSIKLAERDN